MRGWTAICIVLAATGNAAALPGDAGPPTDAGVRDAGPEAVRDAGGTDAGPPTTPIERRKYENAILRRKIAELDQQLATLAAVGKDQTSVPGFDHLTITEPAVAATRIAELIVERNRFAALARGEAAKIKTLAPIWDPPPKKRPRGRPTVAPEDRELNKARLVGLRLNATLLKRKAELKEAERAFLDRTQTLRAEAKAKLDARARALDEEHKKADEEAQAARAREQKALEEQRLAATSSAGILKKEEARLHGLSTKQSEYKGWLITRQKIFERLQLRFSGFRSRVDARLLDLSDREEAADDYDQLYDKVSAELDQARALAIGALGALFRGSREPPEIPRRLSSAVRSLEGAFRADVRALGDLRAKLRRVQREQSHTATILLRQRAAMLKNETRFINQKRIRLLRLISTSKRDNMRGVSATTAHELQGETVLLAISAGNWLHQRWKLIRDVVHGRDLVTLGAFVWRLVVVIMLLFFMRFALRRWDIWMTASVEAVGSAMPLGSSTLFFARAAEIFRVCGPALVVLLTTLAAYQYVGGADAPAEAQIVFVLAFWMSLFRFQLRFLEALVKYISTRAADRRQRRRELSEEEQSAAAAELAAETPPEPAAIIDPERAKPAVTELEPFWSLFNRTWRVATRYVSVVVILLHFTDLAVGEGVFYGLVTRLAWWLFLPFAFYFLRLWRPRVVHEYLKRAPKDGALARITARHADRFYGVFVVAIALFVVLGMSVASFVKENLSNLDATKRMLAFMFRRRVEKHAQEHGRVLDRPHELPAELTSQFPIEPIPPEDNPVRPPELDEIAAAFKSWCDDKADGSLALVGATGMGKSTTLGMLETELGEPVMYGKLISKVTRVDQLMRRLARILELGGEPTTEREMITALQNEERRIIALDNCHNLFLRHVGGFDAWEAFTRVVNETCDNVFWVLTFNDMSWEYLENVASQVSYFRRVVHMKPWSDDDLRKLIIKRTRRARYRVNFTDLLVTRLEGVKMSTQIIGTSQGYFRLLWDFTDGNPRLAGHFWLRSLVPDEESGKKRVRVHLFSAPKNIELEELPDNMLFVMVAVIEHENVTAAELAPITGFTPEFCRFALRYCRERGYLSRDPRTGRTSASYYWQQTLVRYLKRRHLLYS